MSTVQSHEFLPVSSRIRWGAIFAGTMVALAVCLLLGALGMACGLSVSSSAGERELSIGVAAWAIATILISLFVGGWVTSLCVVGENRGEAVIYGVVMWGTVFALLWAMMLSGLRMGFNAVMGVANSPLVAQATTLSDEDLHKAGFTQQQINSFRDQFTKLEQRAQNLPEQLRNLSQDPRVTQAAWWTFGGIVLSLIAAVLGAIAGARPNDRILRIFGVRRTVVTVPRRELLSH
jgi:hypothetical protein